MKSFAIISKTSAPGASSDPVPHNPALHWTPGQRSVSISQVAGPAPVRANVSWLMWSAKSTLTFGAVFLAAFTLAASGWDQPTLFTNKVAIANGQKVLAAILAADSQSKSNIQALIGSQVVFFTHAGPWGATNCVLRIQSNTVLAVEFSPPYKWPPDTPGHPRAAHVYPSYLFYSSEVLGTLKSVDLEKRVVRIVAKQEDWKVRELW